MRYPLDWHILDPDGPLHDSGTVIDIRDANDIRIRWCHVTISEGKLNAKSRALIHGRGTRHSAALRFNREVGLPVIVVSEEKGSISIVHEGKFDSFEVATEYAENVAQPTLTLNDLGLGRSYKKYFIAVANSLCFSKELYLLNAYAGRSPGVAYATTNLIVP